LFILQKKAGLNNSKLHDIGLRAGKKIVLPFERPGEKQSS
jgi:hypothetical protein